MHAAALPSIVVESESPTVHALNEPLPSMGISPSLTSDTSFHTQLGTSNNIGTSTRPVPSIPHSSRENHFSSHVSTSQQSPPMSLNDTGYRKMMRFQIGPTPTKDTAHPAPSERPGYQVAKDSQVTPPSRQPLQLKTTDRTQTGRSWKRGLSRWLPALLNTEENKRRDLNHPDIIGGARQREVPHNVVSPGMPIQPHIPLSAAKQPWREASEILNQILTTQDEMNIERERQRLPQTQPGGVSLPRDSEQTVHALAGYHSSSPGEGFRSSLHQALYESQNQDNIVEFADYDLGNTIDESNRGKIKIAWKQRSQSRLVRTNEIQNLGSRKVADSTLLPVRHQANQKR